MHATLTYSPLNSPSKALPDMETVSVAPPPFRHTPCRFWPRQVTTVWRNLRQHPRSDSSYTFSAKERDPETGLSYFGSRYYNSDLSIWLSVDPMSDKYLSLSPYTYCANNPIRIIDPSGDSCAVLLAGHSVGGASHMAILVQNDKKEWLLWSKNGDDDGNHKRVSGIESGTADDQPGVDKNGNIKTFKSIQEFLDSDYNTDNKDGKGAAYYTKAYMLPTTTEQDKTIIDGMKEKMNEDYHFFGNNCSEAVVYALGKAGVKLDRPQKGEPGNFSYQRPINVGRGMIPRQAYNCIRELHPEGTQFRTNRNTWW